MKIVKYLSVVAIAFLVWSFTATKNNVDKGLVWHTDMRIASKIAQKKTNQFLCFLQAAIGVVGAFVCKKEVFKTPEFEAWAKDKVVLVELDFPRRTPQPENIKTQNDQLQQMFGVRGYPTVWFVKSGNKDGKINFEQLGSTGYVAGGPAAWLDGANQIVAKYVSNKKKANKMQKVKS